MPKLTTAQLEANQKPETCDNCKREIHLDDAHVLVEIIGRREAISGSMKMRPERETRMFCSRKCEKEDINEDAKI